MTLFYHGNTVRTAAEMAKTGVIWSPFVQEMHYLKNTKEKNNHIYERLSGNGNVSIEKVALELAKIELTKQGFTESEIEERVKCVELSLQPDKSHNVIIGTELNYPPQETLFIPRELQLTNVKEIRYQTMGEALRKAFARYKPKFIQL